MSDSLQNIQLNIRPMVIDDLSSIMRLKNAENWNQTNLDWQFLINENPKNCFVACDNKEVVGTVTTMVYGDKLAWIGMMLVAKNYRGLGISKLLMKTVIENLKQIKSIKLDATSAGSPVYKKLGFKSEYNISRMTKSAVEINNLNKTTPLNTSVTKMTKNNITEISKFDEKIYGVNRLALFQFAIKQENASNWFLKKDNKIIGYVLGRCGSQFFQIGPLISYATSDAKILLRNILINFSGKPIIVDVPKHQSQLIDWLISIGFAIQRDFTRMYLKENSCDKTIENQFLIAGPELS